MQILFMNTRKIFNQTSSHVEQTGNDWTGIGRCGPGSLFSKHKGRNRERFRLF